MTRRLTTGWRLSLMLVVLVLGLAPAPSPFTPNVALAQSDLSADPKAVSPTVNDLRSGFQFVPEKSEQREPAPGDHRLRSRLRTRSDQGELRQRPDRDQEPGCEDRERLAGRRAVRVLPPGPHRRLSPAWVESKVSKLGDEATGLTMEGTSAEGPAVAHLFLFRRGAMVVGITVAGLTKPTRMAEAEAIAAVVLRKIDPQYRARPAAPGPAVEYRAAGPRTPPARHSPAGVVGHVDAAGARLHRRRRPAVPPRARRPDPRALPRRDHARSRRSR